MVVFGVSLFVALWCSGSLCWFGCDFWLELVCLWFSCLAGWCCWVVIAVAFNSVDWFFSFGALHIVRVLVFDGLLVTFGFCYFGCWFGC